ncbi:MAG: phosphatidylethanolamine N-methyltransferase family protein [Deltaproteobacteria bacterium]|nr:phosphatidylethanolamine N-methyltransferase family protein [Deltaproteobacteria bacterium]MBW2446349.1 phosphatidylethanolamine N-methyltransferase family protein [Deltaproteobacteria bacterium]
MTTFLLWVLGASGVWLTATALWSIVVPERRLWPPPSPDLNRVQRIGGVLGPGTNFVLLAVNLFGWGSLGLAGPLRFPIGGVLFAAGAYLSLGGVFNLGMPQTQGGEGALVAKGPYRFSRNPQYVGAVLSYVAVALLCNSSEGLLGAAMMTPWLLLPFAEEPWLREKLGKPYEDYAAGVRRYL